MEKITGLPYLTPTLAINSQVVRCFSCINSKITEMRKSKNLIEYYVVILETCHFKDMVRLGTITEHRTLFCM